MHRKPSHAPLSPYLRLLSQEALIWVRHTALSPSLPYGARTATCFTASRPEEMSGSRSRTLPLVLPFKPFNWWKLLGDGQGKAVGHLALQNSKLSSLSGGHSFSKHPIRRS